MITEIILGGLVHHLTPVPPQIETTAFRPSIIVKSHKINVLIGTNSIKELIVGAALDIPINKVNLKIGAYLQDNNKFEDIGVKIKVGDVMPVIAIEYTIPINKKWGITTLASNFIAFGGINYKF